MMHPETTVLKAQGLVFSYSQPTTTPLFDRLSFVVPSGVTWLGGGESSGKTTLLRLLAGALPQNAVQGQLELQGIRLAQDPSATSPGWIRAITLAMAKPPAPFLPTCRRTTPAGTRSRCRRTWPG